MTDMVSSEFPVKTEYVSCKDEGLLGVTECVGRDEGILRLEEVGTKRFL